MTRPGPKPRPVAERFWPKVNIGDPDDCWEWLAGRWGNGYGRFKLAGKSHNAHRIAWELTNGPIPRGLFALHDCDTPLCVNPNHLFLGTQADNLADMVEKGRHVPVPGELNGRSKLSASDVREIRRLRATRKISGTILAKMFRVSSVAISRIGTRQRWAHIP